MKAVQLSIQSQNRILVFALLFILLLSGCNKVAVTDLPQQAIGVDTQGNPIFEPLNATQTLKPQAQQLDLLLVIDSSGSMKPDSLALAAKMESFVRKLEAFKLDWQMCLTTTDTEGNNGGRSFQWSGVGSNVLKKGTPDLSNKFVSTIDAMDFGASGDERGIAAMNLHLDQASQNQCYRPGAALSVVLISDEDERSIGGVQSLNPSQYRALESVDMPENYIAKVQSRLAGPMTSIPHTVHSIIIKPQDQSCLDEQNNQGYAGYVGTYYHKLSSLTGGSVGSICSKDYSENLSVFAEQIQKSLQRVKLKCVPAEGWRVTTAPALANFKAYADGDYIIIESQLTQETLVNVAYTCK